MRTIFVLDEKNYTDDMPCVERHTVRAVIARNGKLAMQKSAAGDYKIPGGGMDPGEDRMLALRREVLEETGLLVLENTVQEIGMTIEIRRDMCDSAKKFLRYTYFYSCDVGETQRPLSLTESEKALGFSAVWADPAVAVAANKRSRSDPRCNERDTRFLEWYLAEYCRSEAAPHKELRL